MKVGILTFHASHNYGSMLQAYALQHTLTNLGVENEIINFRSDIQKSLIEPPLKVCHPRSSFYKIFKEPTKTIQLMRKYNRFELFIRKFLKVGIEINSPEQIPAYIAKNNFDTIITGSDQIWNPGCWDFDMCYLADFPFRGKRIAYAPSLGCAPEQISKEDEDRIRNAISKYDAISTRESQGKDFLSLLTDKPVDVVLDPTLLLDSGDYATLATGKVDISEPYIFYYTPREDSGYFEKAIKLSKLTGLKLMVTQEYSEYRGSDIIRKLDCGPREFLTVIKNATYTIGNSFHLLVFSLIFGREFYLLSKGPDSRMMSLLKPLGLQNRMIINEPITLQSPIDYYMTESILATERNNSVKFLRSALYNV